MENEESEFLYHESCEDCGSSDGRAVYDNNTTFCFACETWSKNEDEGENMEEFMPIEIASLSLINKLGSRGFKERRVSKAVADYFGVKVKEKDNAIIEHYYPYSEGQELVGFKKRVVDGKMFSAIGDVKASNLFGKNVVDENDKRKIVITEGEIDAMTVAQAMLEKNKKIFPVVSLPNGAQSAKKALLANREWLRQFKEVIIMFDNDDAGQKAVSVAVKVIGSDKVKIVTSKYKDASDAYLAEGAEHISALIWDAQPWCPPGVINGDSTWEAYITEKDAVYTTFPPFVSELNDKIFGRRFGSITMFTSGTGSGKTSFLREDAFHLFKTTDDMVGMCSLEESVAETVRGFLALDLNQRVGLPTVEVDEPAEKKAWERTMGTGRFMLLDHQGSVSDGSLIDKIEFMAASGCKFIYLDHVTIAVSEAGGNVNEAIDKLMSDLLKICKRHEVWIGLVSHLRKSGAGDVSYEEGGSISMDDLKGSGSLKQISAQIISLERNKSAEDITKRHTVKVRVLKDRFGGDTGWAGEFRFNYETGRCIEAPKPLETNGFIEIEQDGPLP